VVLLDLNKYLKRIHACRQQNTLDHLKTLQFLHMKHVPFENLDVIRKVPIYLNLEQIYKKIVDNNRGGYCYELNGLFHWLLTNLGYNARLIAATVMRPDGQFAKANTHVAIVVSLDQYYLVDVGFGSSQLQPIALNGDAYEDISGVYKVEKVSDSFYDLMKKDSTSWRIMYRFSLEEKILQDFHEGVVFNQVSPESTFTHHDLVTKATDTGRITLSDHTLTTTKHKKQTKTTLSSSEKEKVLQDIFGIHLTEKNI